MEPALGASTLRDTATLERVGPRTAMRLAEVAELFAADMAYVETALRAEAREGLSPAVDAASHLLEAGGKRVRPLCVLLAAACFGDVLPPATRDLALASEMVHLATLLHDDVVDDGQERRGQATARRLWGNAVSVLAGDLLLTHALERTAAASPGPTLDDLFKTLRRLVDGEIVQLRGRTELDTREATYFTIVRDKTASLFAWAARSGARAAGAPEAAVAALGDFGSHLGVAFQLVDDALDYAGEARHTGKSLLADLHEGKLTLPLLRAVQAAPALLPLLSAARGGDEVASARLLSAVRESRGVEEAKTLARKETQAALAALALVPASRARELLACVAEELAGRIA